MKTENCRALPGWCATSASVTRGTRSCGAAARASGRSPSHSTIAGVVSGEFDRIPEVNDAFLELVGYSREDLLAGRLHWPDLTPPEYAPLDELAHEEGLRFGACTPFEKELIRKDGTRVPVLVATAVLKLSPFRWITFVQDLRERDRAESIEEQDVEPKQDFEEIVGSSAALRRVQRQVEVVAPTDATVLILGETGTGKELVARAIHRMSPRKNLPFVTLNCAAIPTGLLESELFGYERGAFTGALSQKIGRFEMAHRGTLFLDEVGDIPLDLQPKLLRALQEKAFERLGGTKTIPIDVRLVAATNRNLTQMMGDKLFRSDLYYRLKVFPITTPPLRDHPGGHTDPGPAFHQEIRRENGPADRQDPVGHHARPGELALAGERAGAGELHRAVGDPFQRLQPARSVSRNPGGCAGSRPAAPRWSRWSGSISSACCGRAAAWSPRPPPVWDCTGRP